MHDCKQFEETCKINTSAALRCTE